MADPQPLQSPQALEPDLRGKILETLSKGVLPRTDDFFNAIGRGASYYDIAPSSKRSLWDNLARHSVFGGPSQKELKAQQEQAGIIQYAEGVLKQLDAAPTLEQVPRLPSGQLPFPLASSQMTNQVIPSVEEMQTLTRRSGEFSPLAKPIAPGQPLGMSTQYFENPLARTTPYQQEILKGFAGGQTVPTEQGPLPTSLAGIENKKVSPQEIASARTAIQGGTPSVSLPPTLASKVLEEQNKGPATMSDENIVSQQLFGVPVTQLTTKEQFNQLYDRLQESKHPVGIHKNAIAKIYGAQNFDDLARKNTPLTAPEVAALKQQSQKTGVPIVAEVGMPRLMAADATIYQRGIAFAGAGAAARAKGELEQPAGPEAANYYDVKNLQTGRLISAADKEPGITKMDLRSSKTYKFINPNDQQELQQLNNARNTLRELFTRSEYILEPTDQLKASTVQPALIWTWAQGGPGSSDPVKDKAGNIVGTKGEIARAFLDQMKSFGGVVARGVLAERGVLTDADRNVAMQAGVNASDTIQTMKQKQQFFEKLMQFQFKSIARLSDNPNASVADLVKEKEALMKQAMQFKPAQPMPEGSPATPVAPFNDPGKEQRYQEWKAKHQ